MTLSRLHFLTALLLALAFAASSLVAGPIGYSITDLSMGDRQGIASAINNMGQVVGYGSGGPFLWESGRERQALVGISPTDINNAGQVVGATLGPDGHAHAGLWQDGSVQDLGTLPGDPESGATTINDSGQVFGISWKAERSRVFSWQSGSGMQDLGTLGTLGGEFTEATATAINDSGQVAGESHSPITGIYRAFIWQSGSGTQNLGTLPGAEHSEAFDINNSGQVVGSSGGDGYGHAFIWQSGIGMQDLGTLGGTLSWATDINNRGEVLGESTTSGDEFHWFVYSGGQMIDVNNLLLADSNWILESPTDINDAGQIVGYGRIRGDRGRLRAILLSPVDVPEPATYALCGLTLASLVLLQRRGERKLHGRGNQRYLQHAAGRLCTTLVAAPIESGGQKVGL